MRKEILCTLAYADIFDYPLKAREIWRYLIVGKRIDFENVFKEISWLVKKDQIAKVGDFYYLLGRKKIVSIRQRQEKWSKQKLKIAKKVIFWLRLIPTVKMVAVTGALAMKNSDKDDDIDLLIVTSKDRLWLTRVLMVLLVGLVARRRRPGNIDIRDKICLNMFLDEEHLAVPTVERDLFTAHEVCQLLPLWEKGGVYNAQRELSRHEVPLYNKFIKKNKWVKHYLPNWKL